MASIKEIFQGLWAGMQDFYHGLAGSPYSTTLLSRILLALTLIAILWLTFKISNRLLRKAVNKLESWRDTKIKPIRIQTYELVSAARLTEIMKWVAIKTRLVVIVVLLYLLLPAVLSLFPYTRGIVQKYLDYIIHPILVIFYGIVDFIPNLFFIIVVFYVVRYLLRFLRLIFAEIDQNRLTIPGFAQEWANPTFKLLRVLIILLALVMVSPYLPGFGSPAFQGISIFFGVLLSLGSTAAIANIVAGIAITYMRPFHVGDRVKIADTIGDVMEKSFLATRMRTIKNVEVTIPNAMVLGSHMINFSALAAENRLIIYTSVTIGYDAPWRQVHELLKAAARITPGVAAEPEPFVLQTSLNDFSVTYELNVYTGDDKRLLIIQSELHQNIQDKFNEAGVEIMSPTYSAIRDGNEVTIPDDYLPKAAPVKGFRILPPENLVK
ncbi:MAG: mechanosensitive ion channel family protein [Deltaproteobacteria bacterium]|nr:mechanosensitive ion channel family protein [Deltaproteobacteria bacterium]